MKFIKRWWRDWFVNEDWRVHCEPSPFRTHETYTTEPMTKWQAYWYALRYCKENPYGLCTLETRTKKTLEV